MDIAKLFINGRSQAVRLPKEYRFDDAEEVCISKLGDLVILFPKRRGWDLFAEGLAMVTDDFMTDRNQPRKIDRRDLL